MVGLNETLETSWGKKLEGVEGLETPKKSK